MEQTTTLPKRIHCLGIGGIGMSALARLLLQDGHIVSGSDRSLSAITDALAHEGAHIYEGESPENITDDIELVIYSGAVNENNPERHEVIHRGIPSLNYFEALALAVNKYKLIAISGAHGKTTTTAMLTDIFEAAGKDPTAVIGSLRSKTKSNYRKGKSAYAIVEACEYRRHFLNLEPDVLVITNIEHEHVDYYPDLISVQSAFRALAEKVPQDGAVIANMSDPNVAPVVEGLLCTVIDYTKFVDPLLSLTQPGVHNLMNAAAALAAASFEGLNPASSKEALRNFAGTWRRFEYKGEVAGAKIYDDYGHHPSEITATLQGARHMYPDKRVVVVFQPHTFSRTRELFEDFAVALAKADRVVLAPIYAAREENTSGINSEHLKERVNEMGGDAAFYPTFEEIVQALKNTIGENDVVLVMGAGDIPAVTKILTGS